MIGKRGREEVRHCKGHGNLNRTRLKTMYSMHQPDLPLSNYAFHLDLSRLHPSRMFRTTLSHNVGYLKVFSYLDHRVRLDDFIQPFIIMWYHVVSVIRQVVASLSNIKSKNPTQHTNIS